MGRSRKPYSFMYFESYKLCFHEMLRGDALVARVTFRLCDWSNERQLYFMGVLCHWRVFDGQLASTLTRFFPETAKKLYLRTFFLFGPLNDYLVRNYFNCQLSYINMQVLTVASAICLLGFTKFHNKNTHDVRSFCSCLRM